MEIIIVDDKLYQITKHSSNAELKIAIKEELFNTLSVIECNNTCIRNIIITEMKENSARTDIVNYNPMQFDIFIQEYLIYYLYNSEKEKSTSAKAIISHEVFHCKDLLNISSKINTDIISHSCSNNPKQLCTNLGLHQWSEYYSHFNSSKILQSDIITKSTISPENIVKHIKAFCSEPLFSDTDFQKIVYNNSIYPFLAKLIILLANVNSQNHVQHVTELEKYKSLSPKFSLYINNLSNMLTSYIENYPSCITEDSLYELGKSLLNLHNIF